jgi:hypothetical protein
MAFVFTFAMVVVVLLLMRSLGKHLRKVRTNPPVTTASDTPDGTPGTASGDLEDGDGGGDVVADETDDR